MKAIRIFGYNAWVSHIKKRYTVTFSAVVQLVETYFPGKLQKIYTIESL